MLEKLALKIAALFLVCYDFVVKISAHLEHFWKDYELWKDYQNLQNTVQNEVQVPCGKNTKQSHYFKNQSLSPFSFWFQLFKIVEIERDLMMDD